MDGEIRFDAGSRGAYSTDGSTYRQVPISVVVSRTVCREHDAPVLSHGGEVLQPDRLGGRGARTCVVEPGIFLDDLDHVLGGADR